MFQSIEILTLVGGAAVVLLAYFVVRRDFLQLSVDRALVYAAVLVALAMAHQLVFQDVSARLPEGARTPLAVLEVAAVGIVVLMCRPLRQRSAEALRYLMGAWVAGRRERLRQLATQMSAHAGRSPDELVRWFGDALRCALDVDYVAAWEFHADGKTHLRWGQTERLDETLAASLQREISAAGVRRCTRRDAPTVQASECLESAGAALAVLRAGQDACSLLLIGKHRRNRLLSDEEIHAVLLLVEQLAVTRDNSALQAERLDAERRAAQAEKLSMLGLLASSIAHEIKNPLSAIKTIAAVLAEDLGPASPHAEDVRLILGEIDRLAATTNQLFDFARPRSERDRPACAASVITGAMRMLRHLARQRNITVEWTPAPNLPAVRAGEQALREIFFNLLVNALDAAGPDGRVIVTCAADAGAVVTEVRDSGPGIPPTIRDRLFEPFLTTKAHGTGLGLYAVGRRVRELGGDIVCTSEPGRGTAFTVRLPRDTTTACGFAPSRETELRLPRPAALPSDT